jgi:hypothetical protein
VDTAAIIHEILERYVLPIRGHHGVVHWARVLENGQRMAAVTGAKIEVVTLHPGARAGSRRRPLGIVSDSCITDQAPALDRITRANRRLEILLRRLASGAISA